MGKKTKSGKEGKRSAGLFDSALAGSVGESAQQIWLAGLGAFAKAQQEGGKVFEALVQDGLSLQRQTQQAATEKLAEVGERATEAAEAARERGGEQWDRLETLFEQRVSKALERLAVPSAAALEALAAQVEALSEEVRRLSGTASDAADAPEKAARKPAAKKSAARKSA